jgi:hypothetical protein
VNINGTVAGELLVQCSEKVLPVKLSSENFNGPCDVIMHTKSVGVKVITGVMPTSTDATPISIAGIATLSKIIDVVLPSVMSSV